MGLVHVKQMALKKSVYIKAVTQTVTAFAFQIKKSNIILMLKKSLLSIFPNN
jgi:hypothetical protein